MKSQESKFMKSNLFVKFYVAILSVILTILLSYGMINYNDQKNSNIKIMENQAIIVAKTMLLANTNAILNDATSYIIDNSLEFMEQNKGVKYLVFYKKYSENIVVYNNKWSLVKDIAPKYKALQKEDSQYLIMKGEFLDEEVFHFTYPINISSYNWGWIHIGFSLDGFNNNLQKIYENFIFVTLIAFLISVLFTYIFTKWMLKPILQLNKRTKAIVKGDYKLIPNVNRSDEIYELSYNFNIMIEHLIRTQKEVEKSKHELEDKVNLRTKELKELNKLLDKKVQKEVIKRRNQEKYLYEQIKLAQMGEMLNNIAHQWRQPLSVITTATSGLKLKKDMNLPIEKEFDDTYELVMENANYLTKIIETFSKYTQEDYDVEYVDLKDVIDDIITLNIDILKKNFINIEINYKENQNLIETIPTLLSQVMFNILMNANNALIKKDIENRDIKISVNQDELSYTIDIEDNAGGIDKDIIDNIFEPYFTTKHSKKGTGMGLYLSYDIVANHLNGNIFAKNAENGAIFSIKLPHHIEKYMIS